MKVKIMPTDCLSYDGIKNIFFRLSFSFLEENNSITVFTTKEAGLCISGVKKDNPHDNTSDITNMKSNSNYKSDILDKNDKKVGTVVLNKSIDGKSLECMIYDIKPVYCYTCSINIETLKEKVKEQKPKNHGDGYESDGSRSTSPIYF